MLKKISVVLGIIVAGILIVAAFRSSEMKISREIVISTSPENLFPHINNSQKSYGWMPWAEGDPGIEIKFTGPEEGIGSKSNWNGKEMGIGSSEIIESIPNQVVRTKLEYTEPFEMLQTAEVSLTPTTGGTLVKWSVSGHNNYFFRLVGIFMDCDEMVGGEFEKGLNQLKRIVELK